MKKTLLMMASIALLGGASSNFALAGGPNHTRAEATAASLGLTSDPHWTAFKESPEYAAWEAQPSGSKAAEFQSLFSQLKEKFEAFKATRVSTSTVAAPAPAPRSVVGGASGGASTSSLSTPRPPAPAVEKTIVFKKPKDLTAARSASFVTVHRGETAPTIPVPVKPKRTESATLSAESATPSVTAVSEPVVAASNPPVFTSASVAVPASADDLAERLRKGITSRRPHLEMGSDDENEALEGLEREEEIKSRFETPSKPVSTTNKYSAAVTPAPAPAPRPVKLTTPAAATPADAPRPSVKSLAANMGMFKMGGPGEIGSAAAATAKAPTPPSKPVAEPTAEENAQVNEYVRSLEEWVAKADTMVEEARRDPNALARDIGPCPEKWKLDKLLTKGQEATKTYAKDLEESIEKKRRDNRIVVATEAASIRTAPKSTEAAPMPVVTPARSNLLAAIRNTKKGDN